jgi:hypothetical protein
MRTKEYRDQGCPYSAIIQGGVVHGREEEEETKISCFAGAVRSKLRGRFLESDHRGAISTSTILIVNTFSYTWSLLEKACHGNKDSNYWKAILH